MHAGIHAHIYSCVQEWPHAQMHGHGCMHAFMLAHARMIACMCACTHTIVFFLSFGHLTFCTYFFNHGGGTFRCRVCAWSRWSDNGLSVSAWRGPFSKWPALQTAARNPARVCKQSAGCFKTPKKQTNKTATAKNKNDQYTPQKRIGVRGGSNRIE